MADPLQQVSSEPVVPNKPLITSFESDPDFPDPSKTYAPRSLSNEPDFPDPGPITAPPPSVPPIQYQSGGPPINASPSALARLPPDLRAEVDATAGRMARMIQIGREAKDTPEGEIETRTRLAELWGIDTTGLDSSRVKQLAQEYGPDGSLEDTQKLLELYVNHRDLVAAYEEASNKALANTELTETKVGTYDTFLKSVRAIVNATDVPIKVAMRALAYLYEGKIKEVVTDPIGWQDDVFKEEVADYKEITSTHGKVKVDEQTGKPIEVRFRKDSQGLTFVGLVEQQVKQREIAELQFKLEFPWFYGGLNAVEQAQLKERQYLLAREAAIAPANPEATFAYGFQSDVSQAISSMTPQQLAAMAATYVGDVVLTRYGGPLGHAIYRAFAPAIPKAVVGFDSLRAETGGFLLETQDWKLQEPGLRLGAALLAGGIKMGFEIIELPHQTVMYGPLGHALKTGNRRVLMELIRDNPSLRKFASELGKLVLEGAKSEGREEGSQQLTDEVMKRALAVVSTNVKDDLSPGAAVARGMDAYKAGASGGFGASFAGATMHYGNWKYSQWKIDQHQRAISALTQATPEQARVLGSNPTLADAVMRNVRNSTGVETSTVYVASGPLLSKLSAMGSNLEEWSTSLGLDFNKVGSLAALEQGRIPIPLTTYFKNMLDGQYGKLGRELLWDTTADLNTPSANEFKLQQQSVKDYEAVIKKQKEQGGSMALEWERAELIFDKFEQALKDLKLWDKSLAHTARVTLERIHRTVIARGWFHSPYQLAAMYVPEIITTPDGKPVTRAQLQDKNFIDSVLKGREPVSRMAAGVPSSRSPEGRIVVPLDKIPSGGNARFVPAVHRISTGKTYMHKDDHGAAIMKAGAGELTDLTTEELENLSSALVGETTKEWVAGFVERETGRLLPRSEAAKLSGEQIVTSFNIDEVMQDIKFAQQAAWTKVVKANEKDRTLTDATGKEFQTSLRYRAAIAFGQPNDGKTLSSSYIMHEIMHVIIPMMTDIATQDNAPQDLKDATLALLKVGGYTSIKDYLDSRAAGMYAQYFLQSFALLHKPQDRKRFEDYTPADAAKVQRDGNTLMRHIEDYKRYVAGEEKIAIKFEHYLLTGTAPSNALDAAFLNLRLLYTDPNTVDKVKPSFSAEVTEEDHRAFDIMMATEYEMRRRLAILTPTQNFRTPQEAGMSPTDFLEFLKRQRLQLTTGIRQEEMNHLNRLKRLVEGRMKKAAKVARKKIIEDKLGGTQVWMDLFGPKADIRLTATDAMELLGLTPEDIVKKEPLVWRMLNKAGIISDKDTTPAAVVAERWKDLDYKQILDAIAETPGNFIESDVNAQVTMHLNLVFAKELADIQEAAENAATRAVAESTEDALKMEMRAIHGKVVGLGPPAFKALREAAVEIVRSYARKAVHGRAFQALEHQSASSAMEAVAAGEFAVAANYYRERMIWFYASVEAARMRAKFGVLESMARKLRTDREEVGKAHPDFARALDYVGAALGANAMQLDFTQLGPTMDTVSRYVEDNGSELAYDPHMLQTSLQRLYSSRGTAPLRTQLGKLTIEEADNLEIFIKQVKKTASVYRGMIVEGREVTIQQLTEAGLEETKNQRLASGRSIDHEAQTRMDAIIHSISSSAASLRHPLYLLSRLGPTALRAFYERYKDLKEKDNTLSKILLTKFTQIWMEMPDAVRKRLDERLADVKERLPIVGREANLKTERTRGWLLMVALNMGNPRNLESLLIANGWTFPQLKKYVEDNMTTEELMFVQKIWSFMDEQLYPLIKEHYESVNGTDPGFTVGSPLILTLKDGTEVALSGGYFPWRPDRADVVKSTPAKSPERLRDVYDSRRFGGAQVARGFTHARVWNPSIVDVLRSNEKTALEILREKLGLPTEGNLRIGPMLDLNWRTVPRHIAEVVHYVSYDRGVREMYATLTNEEYAKFVRERIGVEGEKQLLGWVKDLASGHDFDVHGLTAQILRGFDWMKGAVTRSALGMSLTLPAGDTVALLLAKTSGLIDAKYLTDATMSNFYEMREFAKQHSQELRLRAEGAHLEKIRAQISNIGKAKWRQDGKITQFMKDNAWITFDFMDRVLSTWIWTAAYNQELHNMRALAPNVPLTEEQTRLASKTADRKVEMILPANEVLEKPAILRDRRGVGLLVVFFGWFAKMSDLSMQIMDPALDQWFKKEGVKGKTKMDVIVGAKSIMSLLGTWMAMQVIGEVISGRGKDDKEEWWQFFARKLMITPFMFVPLVGQAVEGVVDRSILGYGKFSSRGNPVMSWVERTWLDFNTIREWDKNGLNDHFWAAMHLLLAGRGLPANQLTRTGEYFTGGIVGVESAKEFDANPLTGLFYGEQSAKRVTPLNPWGG